MLLQLPTELKINILEHVDKKSLPAVSQTNSTFREITEPILYSAVILTPFLEDARRYKTVIECFRAIVSRPSAAAAVRKLHVSLQHHTKYDSDIVGQVLTAFGGALPKLGNLERLEIPFWNDRYQYPTGLPRGSPLRSLQHYYGPPEVIDNIQSNVFVTLRIRSYRLKPSEVSRALLAAARSNAMALRTLGIRRHEHDDDEKSLEFMRQIPLLFPNIRFLDLGNWPMTDEHVIDQLIPSLAIMENLRLLKLMDWWMIDLKDEELHVKRLHQGCPQLREISLAGSKWRFSEELRQWAPALRRRDHDPRTEEIWVKGTHKYLVDPQMDGFDYEFIKY
ncbi:hypothetical protein FRC01_007228 [Tulasnella sp. 417]|nr:hypothetical protein FRC01_007228 [Tulasnella sp. 417]